ncbi:FadR/GntR family transcriptional regulator [Salinifilum ghardaiensis]
MPLSADLAERLLGAVIDGTHPPGAALPPEAELAEQHGVSRLTVREAVSSLRAQNIVHIRRGLGTYVNEPGTWTALDPVIRAANAGPAHGALSESLLEARRVLEEGAAELAAAKRTEEDLARLREHLAAMRAAHEQSDVDAFVRADLAFHDALVRASGNIFVPLMFAPFGRLLPEGRHETSAVAAIRENATAQHEHIVRALESGDPARARSAMAAHMTQTGEDLRRHVLGPADAGPP